MENQKRICVAICFGSSNHFTGLYWQNILKYQLFCKSKLGYSNPGADFTMVLRPKPHALLIDEKKKSVMGKTYISLHFYPLLVAA